MEGKVRGAIRGKRSAGHVGESDSVLHVAAQHGHTCDGSCTHASIHYNSNMWKWRLSSRLLSDFVVSVEHPNKAQEFDNHDKGELRALNTRVSL